MIDFSFSNKALANFLSSLQNMPLEYLGSNIRAE